MNELLLRDPQPAEVILNGEKTYAVGEKISNGKFGQVFACRDGWGQPRILRIVRPFSRNYENLRETWSQQAAELRRVQHPNLVYIFDSFESDGLFHLVLERCDYRLDQHFASPVWDGARWLRAIAGSVLGALDHVHRAGYLHMNLHPHNLFCQVPLERLDPDSPFSGVLKLGDLGVNTLVGKVDVLNTKLPRWLVPPEYLSPSECGPMDHRMDIYQAGLLLLCVLQGRITLYSFEEISVGAPERNARQLASGYGEVVARALRPEVDDRFRNAREFWEALSGVSR